MKTVTNRQCSIDSVFIGEVTISLLDIGPSIEATIGFMNSKTGDRLGSSRRNRWSAETLQKFTDFVDSMEEDVARALFGGQEETDQTPSGDERVVPTSASVPGL